MSWLIVGIVRFHYPSGSRPLLAARIHRAKPNRAIRFPDADVRLAYAEDRDAAIAVMLQI
jgi:hypothetical protein